MWTVGEEGMKVTLWTLWEIVYGWMGQATDSSLTALCNCKDLFVHYGGGW